MFALSLVEQLFGESVAKEIAELLVKLLLYCFLMPLYGASPLLV